MKQLINFIFGLVDTTQHKKHRKQVQRCL